MHIKDLFSMQCCMATVGVCMVGFGAMFSVFWEDMFESALAKEMALGPDTRSYEMWKTPPIPMSIDIYLFNWTNPTGFEAFEKPILKELGPYRFTELMDKVDIEWSPHNSTVSYRRKSTYFFDEAGSKGSLNDTITTLNIIALSAAAKAKTWSYMQQKGASMGLTAYNQQVHVTKSAGELLFEGYQDDMIDMAREMPSFMGMEPQTVPFDRFGWFYMRNGTSNLTGHYNMNTGADDISQIGRVESWDYQQRTEFYPRECGMINGSAGEFYPPNQTKDTPISFYSADMCRTLNFDFERETEVHGIKGYKYSAGRRAVDNGTEFPANECFNIGERVPSGVINVTACRYGTPAFMSYPHFYAADPYYLDQVEGMRPNQSRHEFAMTMEPKTGIPLDVAARLQINMLITPVQNVALYENAPRMFFPVLWFEQHVRIAEPMAAEIRMVLAMPHIGYMCCAALVAIGVVLTIWLPLVRLVLRRRRSNRGDRPAGKYNGNLDKHRPEGSPLMGGGVAAAQNGGVVVRMGVPEKGGKAGVETV